MVKSHSPQAIMFEAESKTYAFEIVVSFARPKHKGVK